MQLNLQLSHFYIQQIVRMIDSKIINPHAISKSGKYIENH